jgi:hypothetical protein
MMDLMVQEITALSGVPDLVSGLRKLMKNVAFTKSTQRSLG